MAMTNSETRYGFVTKSFHWLTALLILSLMPLGIIANEMPFDTSEALAQKAWLFSLHKTLGVLVFFVALLRILWAISQPKPGPMHPDRVLETWAAETVHWLLYMSLVIVPLSGWIHHAATTGFAPIWWPFGQSLPLVPKDDGVAEITAGLHNIFTKVLGLSILLHIAGALKHHIIDKDATLRRMWFGDTRVPEILAMHKVTGPLITALAVWVAALWIGSSLGAFKHSDGNVASVALAEVASDWQVQEGTLGIAVTQLGSEITGTFEDWTAAITFDDTVEDGVAGSVEVTVAIGSLTLGSVTAQAMGPEYFAATEFPTAVFTADISRSDAGYVAEGTLTLKGQTVPATLPFTLQIEDDVAQMEGKLTVNRTDFGIGAGDETNLKFAVDINVALTAARGSVDAAEQSE